MNAPQHLHRSSAMGSTVGHPSKQLGFLFIFFLTFITTMIKRVATVVATIDLTETTEYSFCDPAQC